MFQRQGRAEKPSRVISVELSGPLNENSFGDHLGQELKCSELNEGEKVETIKMSLSSQGECLDPPIPQNVPAVHVFL